MSSQRYTINFKNNSSRSGSACIYQRNPNAGYQFFSLAWFARFLPPGSMNRFEWDTEYSFVCGETGRLAPGVNFRTSQGVSTDPSSNNSVTLTNNGGMQFSRTTPREPKGRFYITIDGSVPMGSASVGIGMSGEPAVVSQAQPNMNFMIDQQFEYWAAFGDFQPGQVLDANAINNAVHVSFPSGVYAMDVILEPNNSFRVSPSR